MTSKKIMIVTDSSAHLPPDAAVDLDISVIPLWLIWDNESYQDGVDIDPARFYQRLKDSRTLPTTSQPTPPEFISFFQKEAETADAVVSIVASSKISGTFESACMAKDKLPDLDIRVVDSASSSMGQGLIVLGAARAAAAGKTVDEVEATAIKIRDKIQLIFVVDTLEFLHRSGRIKATKRALGTLLQVKPILHFEDGLIQSLTSERTMKKATARLLDIIECRLDGKNMAEAAVVDIDARDRGDQIAELISSRFSPSEIQRSGVSPVVGAVVGPGAFGVAFYAED